MKALFTLLFFFTVSIACVAQNAPIDFETGGFGANFSWTTFENATNPPVQIIANPDPTGANISTTVAEFTALQAGQPYAGCETQHTVDFGVFPLTNSVSEVRIMVWKPEISNVGIKLVTTSGGALQEILVPNTVINQWEELIFDFSPYVGNAIYAIEDVDQIVVFPDFNARAQDNICYFDNISIGPYTPGASPAAAAPDPTIAQPQVISMFSDVYSDVPVDTWQTVWSAGTLTDLPIAGNATKRYTGLDFVGVETVMNQIDISDMDTFHVDMWTPNMTEFRVKLVDFGPDGGYQGGDDSEHEIVISNPTQNVWNSLAIPMADFVGMTGRMNFAQLIFSGNPSGQGTVYIDNVFFSKEISTGVPQVEEFGVALFPNPATDVIQVSADQQINALSIYDLTGKQVFIAQPLSHVADIDASAFESGVYAVELKIADQVLIEKVVVR